MALFDEDPAAEFLSREQDALGDVLGAGSFELISDTPPVTAGSLDFLADDTTLPGDEAPADFLAAEEPVANTEPVVFAEPEPEVTAAPVFAPEPTEPTNVYTALSEAAEPESIRLWKLKQAEEIAARDAEAEALKSEWKAEAAKELDAWHAKQLEVLAKNKAGNREAQEAFFKDMQEAKPGQQWEKICKLCDFNPKSNRNARDTARMRSLFLQLKQTPLVR